MTHDIANREGLAPYDVHWTWSDQPLEAGITAVLRVKDESRNLPWVLPPLLKAVSRVVVVDNLSSDDSAGTAVRIAEQEGASERVQVTRYPFEVSRCGADHLATPADSVHSLTHYYNWSFAHVGTTHSLKWDGDMVLTPEGVELLSDVEWQLGSRDTIVVFQHFPLYVESERVGYFDVGLRNLEPWIYPTGPAYRYVKGFDWEVPDFPATTSRLVMPQGICFELKWLDSDEFGHWTTTDDFEPTRTPRKVRELEVFRALREGRFHDLTGVHRIEAPPGVHIVDHVATSWLPRAARPLTSWADPG